MRRHKRKPDRAYLGWIAGLPCVVCQTKVERTDAHHVLGKRFWAHHGLDRDALVAELQRRYDAEVAAA